MIIFQNLWFILNPNLYFATQEGVGMIRIGTVLHFAFVLAFFNILSSWVVVNFATRTVGKLIVGGQGAEEEWGVVEDHFTFYTAALPWAHRITLAAVVMLFLPTGALIFNWAVSTITCLARG